jgi:hypothetical protein
MDAPRHIDWSTAVVKDGELTVEVDGEPSRGWSEHVQGVLERLAPSGRDPIKVTKHRIKVRAVAEAEVDELRHLLESAIQQANADLAPAAPEEQAPPQEAAEGDSRDEELTEAFRAFAP